MMMRLLFHWTQCDYYIISFYIFTLPLCCCCILFHLPRTHTHISLEYYYYYFFVIRFRFQDEECLVFVHRMRSGLCMVYCFFSISPSSFFFFFSSFVLFINWNIRVQVSFTICVIQITFGSAHSIWM